MSKKHSLIIAAFALALAILAGNGWLTYRNMTMMAESDRRASRTYRVMQDLDEMLSDLNDAETAQRSFIITGEAKYLEPYRHRLNLVDQGMAAVRLLTVDSPRQQERLKGLELLIKDKLAELQQLIDLRATKGFQPAYKAVVSGTGKDLKSEIRKGVAAVRDEEEQLLARQSELKAARARETLQSLVGGGLASFLLLSSVFVLLRREIGQRARTEEELRRSTEETRVKSRVLTENEERYRSLVTATAQIVWTTNAQGEVVEELPTWQAFTGQTFDEYKGWGWSKALHPDDLERTRAAWLKALSTTSLYEIDYRLRRQDGEYRHVTTRGVPVLERDGRVREWIGTCRDITERKEAEKRREFTNDLLALFARKSSAAGYLDSVVHVLREWSGSHALGIRVVEDNQEIPFAAWAGYDAAFVELENRLSLQTDNCCCLRALSQPCEEVDRPLVTPSGSYRCDDAPAFFHQLSTHDQARFRGNCIKFGFVSIAVIPIRYRDEMIGAIHLADRRANQFPPATVEFIESMAPLIGEAIHRFQAEAELADYRGRLEELVEQRTNELVLANNRLQLEISERKHAQDALQQAARELERSNRDLEQFAYVASHDLQEPLRAVGGYVKLLQRRFPEKLDAKAREYIGGAVDGAARMERLITDLLAFSRVGAGPRAATRADLNTLLDSALSNLGASIKATQAKVTREPLPTLAVDSSQLVQLFQNLIGNALKFQSEEPPQIHISAEKRDGSWVFTVRDNGIGIEPQYFQRIFQIFQRLHTRKHYPGTGIGLAICKKIVEGHGGAIWVESSLGKGSTFCFSIPEISAISHSVV